MSRYNQSQNGEGNRPYDSQSVLLERKEKKHVHRKASGLNEG